MANILSNFATGLIKAHPIFGEIQTEVYRGGLHEYMAGL